MDYKNLTFASMGIKEINKENFKKPENSACCLGVKPEGGLWFCQYETGKPTSWQTWCLDEDFKDMYSAGVKFTLKDDTNFFVIDTNKDIDLLFDEYLCEQDKTNPLPLTMVNYEKLKEEYDGLYVTENGIQYAYMRMYGWDVESGILFDIDAIKEWTPISKKEFKNMEKILDGEHDTDVSDAGESAELKESAYETDEMEI